MDWWNLKSRLRKPDVESAAEVHLDLSSDRWPLDLDFHNIITIIRKNEEKNWKEREKVRQE